jgi:hypothetical protein
LPLQTTIIDVLYRQVLYVYLKSRAMTIVLTYIRIFMSLSMDIKTKGIFLSIWNVCFPFLSFTFQKWSIDRMLSLRTCDVLAIFYLCFVFVCVFFIFVCFLYLMFVCVLLFSFHLTASWETVLFVFSYISWPAFRISSYICQHALSLLVMLWPTSIYSLAIL